MWMQSGGVLEAHPASGSMLERLLGWVVRSVHPSRRRLGRGRG